MLCGVTPGEIQLSNPALVTRDYFCSEEGVKEIQGITETTTLGLWSSVLRNGLGPVPTHGDARRTGFPSAGRATPVAFSILYGSVVVQVPKETNGEHFAPAATSAETFEAPAVVLKVDVERRK